MLAHSEHSGHKTGNPLSAIIRGSSDRAVTGNQSHRPSSHPATGSRSIQPGRRRRSGAMHSNSILRGWTLATVLIVPALTLTLAAPQTSSLVVNGQQGTAQVIQVQGRNYVEVEGLARLVNGSISFNGSQMVLTLPGSGGDTSPDTASPPAAGFSKEFMNAGIEAMAEVREWHTALKTTIEHGLPITADWLNSYGAQAQQALRVASVAVNTD